MKVLKPSFALGDMSVSPLMFHPQTFVNSFKKGLRVNLGFAIFLLTNIHKGLPLIHGKITLFKMLC